VSSNRPTMAVSVRLARPGDESALAGLNAFVHDLHLANHQRHFKPARLDEVAHWFGTMIQQFSVRIWIAEERGVPIGYASVVMREEPETPFRHARRWYEIEHIAVQPSRRLLGVARALVQAVVESALGGGIEEIEVTSWTFNEGAQVALRKLGFSPKNVRFGLQLPMG
jgi:GNAT superfamily N-acetyltransferase